MAHKITRVVTALAICWLFAYGVGSAASHCCSAVINICIPSGVRSPLMTPVDIHCQPSPSHHLSRYISAVKGTGLQWHDSDDLSKCCSATPCSFASFFAVQPVQPPPTSLGLHAAGNACKSDGDHNTMAIAPNRYNPHRPTIPIFLLTQTIIC